ncbi:early nodulin-like protein 1 [Ricinus communis]|uniref:Early nodulin 55-2, putative n=1 Tax=Ricinus communis TaxID=3988 RepID=B9SA44_RICCO|nr:early nodulin-like protein 1 [Ricinus communis]EEF39561.1 Early nodulin 55-2 precursor, putative [Ricinus communis]|eukprot:XP_002522863.1 early nodulin-like protein 1 [Ricinus communis]
MANTVSRSNYQHKNAFAVLGLFCVMLMLQKGDAIQFTVGGAKGWTVPKNTTAYEYNQWAEKTRFQIGDSLLFVYKPDQDSVLLVNKQDYDSCTTTAALATYDDGHTVYTFNRSGHFYFISGNKDNCLKNEKLIVVVLADRSNRSSYTNETTTASPPPSGEMGIVPSPAPAGEEAPPAGTVENNPSPSPVSDTPNAASVIYMSFSAAIGAFFASYLILIF